MHSLIDKIEAEFKKRCLAYSILACVSAIIFCVLLYISLMFAKPSDFTMYYSWDTPPEIYIYRKYWGMFLSTALISILIIALLLTITIPFYLIKRQKLDSYFNTLKNKSNLPCDFIYFLRYATLFTSIIWFILTITFCYDALSELYPPVLLETVEENHDIATARHWEDYTYFLFYVFIILGSISALSPPLLSFYFFNKKGRV